MYRNQGLGFVIYRVLHPNLNPNPVPYINEETRTLPWGMQQAEEDDDCAQPSCCCQVYTNS